MPHLRWHLPLGFIVAIALVASGCNRKKGISPEKKSTKPSTGTESSSGGEGGASTPLEGDESDPSQYAYSANNSSTETSTQSQGYGNNFVTPGNSNPGTGNNGGGGGGSNTEGDPSGGGSPPNSTTPSSTTPGSADPNASTLAFALTNAPNAPSKDRVLMTWNKVVGVNTDATASYVLKFESGPQNSNKIRYAPNVTVTFKNTAGKDCKIESGAITPTAAEKASSC